MPTHSPTHSLPTAEEVAIARESGRALSAFLQTRAETQQIEIFDDKGASHRVRIPATNQGKITCLKVRRYACQPPIFAPVRRASQLARTPVSRTFNSRLVRCKTWLKANVGKVLKGSLTRRAMEYTLNQWVYLVGYCERGNLNISNVLAENAI